MSVQLLFTHFDRISEAPDAIPRLRRFILDLAVRGKGGATAVAGKETIPTAARVDLQVCPLALRLRGAKD
jgi:hypothetical protein